MRKWIIIAPLLFSLTGMATSFAAPADQPAVTVTVNGKLVNFDVQPVNDQGTVYVPLRFVADELGGMIVPGNNKAILISKGTITLSITAGSTAAYKNQQPFTLAAAPRLVNGRMLVPLRVLSEVFEASVTYADGQVAITQEESVQPAGPGVMGNSIGNLNNWGLYAADNEWVYFNNPLDSGRLYKQKKDGTELQKLSDDEFAAYINLVGGKLYYTGDNNKLFSMNTDGSARTMIRDFAVGKNLVSVVDDWIYFTQGNSSMNKPLYRMKTDGSSRTVLEQYGVSSLAVYGGKIYYTIDFSKLFVMDLDGSRKKKLLDGGYITNIVMKDDIMYLNFKEHLYTMNIDGTGLTQISALNGREMNLSGNYLYFSNYSEYSKKLFRLNLSDYTSEKQGDDKTLYIHIVDNKLYYMNATTNRFVEVDIE
ncbi:DUF5050 domain-containing protein [Paenibacillus sp. FSL R7-0312]|uniref:DUF5050 domain-containing protein n=1 Tax=Paenibacillus sp. FSL R7-0312 TaxID=2921682 RepID=UPI0030F6BD57